MNILFERKLSSTRAENDSASVAVNRKVSSSCYTGEYYRGTELGSSPRLKIRCIKVECECVCVDLEDQRVSSKGVEDSDVKS